MEAAFAGTDAEGAWVWKDAYEACEAAQVIFLRKFGAAMRSRAGSATAMLEMLAHLAARLSSQTRRSEESEQFQQFSTPLALGFVATEAPMLTPADLVLEPSAGTGLLPSAGSTSISPATISGILTAFLVPTASGRSPAKAGADRAIRRSGAWLIATTLF
jgi:hypothetical protein